MRDERLLLGQFGRVHGVKGEIYFTLYGTQDILSRVNTLFLKDGTSLRVLAVRPAAKGRFIIKVEGIDTPLDAEKLVNQKAYVDAVPGEGDSYTTSELRAMDLVLGDRVIGRILGIQGEEAPVLVVEVDGEIRLIPFTREALRIDREEQTVELLDEGFMV